MSRILLRHTVTTLVLVVFTCTGFLCPSDGPRIELSTTELVFPPAEVGRSSTRTLVIRNTGNATLSWRVTDTPEGFSCSPVNGTIDPSGADTVAFAFSLSTEGIHSATLVIRTNVPGNRDFGIHVSGSALRSPWPDLVVIYLNTPQTILIGQKMDIVSFVKNQGNQTAHGVVTVIYASTDHTITTDDIELFRYTFVSLAPGQIKTKYVTISVPSTLDGRSIYVGAIIDPDNTVEETWENNNTRYASGKTWVEGLPDLVVSSVIVPSFAYITETLSVSLCLENRGDGKAQNITAKVYASPDRFISTSDMELGQCDLSQLAYSPYRNIWSRSVIAITLPASLAGSDIYIGAIVDPENTIPENNETNNTGLDYGKVHVVSAPDLLVTVNAIESGATLILSYTITNRGGEPASDIVTHFYASSNADITDLDTYLGADTHAELVPGQSVTRAIVVSPPSAGQWYIGAIVDPYQAIPESNEGNNTFCTTTWTRVY
jgi:subtilase family serine protease